MYKIRFQPLDTARLSKSVRKADSDTIYTISMYHTEHNKTCERFSRGGVHIKISLCDLVHFIHKQQNLEGLPPKPEPCRNGINCLNTPAERGE